MASLLSGCANLAAIHSFSTRYEPPASGERARIRVTTDGMVRAVPGRACVDWNAPGAGVMAVPQRGFANRNDERLGMPSVPAPVAKSDTAAVVSTELYIPAGVPVVLDFLGPSDTRGGIRYQCAVSLSFVATAGRDYQAQFFQDRDICPYSIQVIGGDSAALLSKVKTVPAAPCQPRGKF
jgi:hypothetical protein